MQLSAERIEIADPACRLCGAGLTHNFVDLGAMPPANSFLSAADLDRDEMVYPLHAYVCGACFLVQIEAFQTPEQIFADYAYFSSFSDTWLHHAERYAEAMIERLALNPASRVMEVASNDGYLLRHFKARGVPVLGVEPAANVAEVARARGIPTEVAFFGRATALRLAAEGRTADLIAANNVLAHVPDLHDFVAGFAAVLKPSGVLTVEFPHLLALMEGNQFDTIYHEHFSYFSLATVQRIFADHGLAVFDVEALATHGGSLRVYACHAEFGPARGSAVAALLATESAAGLARIETYAGFAERVRETKRRLLTFLVEAKAAGRTVVGYGAPAKGNTLLNYCGVGTDLLDYTVDRSPHKQGSFLPGSRIPVHAPERLAETRPDYVLILPWNLKDEIVVENAHIRNWGGRFVVPVPCVEVLP